jgi:tetratricopeptide (TPR) repeat protein
MPRAGRIGTVIAIALLGLGGVVFLLVAKHVAQPKVKSPAPVQLGPTAAPRQTPGEPRTAGEWYAHANALLNDAKDYRGAAEAYARAAELAPEMGEAHYGRGFALLQLDDLDGAIPELESSLSLAPEKAAWRTDAQNALVLANLKKTRAEKR